MTYESMNTAWLRKLEELLTAEPAEARGLKFRESIGGSITCDMKQPILSVASRKLGYKFMAAEAWWILSGRNDVRSIAPYSKMIEKFSDDGMFFFGSYGPKIVDQLPYVIDALTKDPGSRRAVINIWREKPTDSKDYPCTLSVQWMVRNGELHCLDTMRSSDIWLGTPYDIVNFSCVSAFLLLCLRQRDRAFDDISLGPIRLTCGSQHIYDSNIDAAREVLKAPQGRLYASLNVDEFGDPWRLLEHLEQLKDGRPLEYHFMSEVVEWQKR